MWVFWLIVAGVMFIGEIFTLSFLLFWIGIGSLCAMALSLFNANLPVQFSIFIALSALLIMLTKPLTNRLLKRDSIKTNASAYEGKRGFVTLPVNNIASSGQVKVAGEFWSAVSEDNQIIEADAEVEIVRIEGVKAIVKRVAQANDAKIESIPLNR